MVNSHAFMLLPGWNCASAPRAADDRVLHQVVGVAAVADQKAGKGAQNPAAGQNRLAVTASWWSAFALRPCGAGVSCTFAFPVPRRTGTAVMSGARVAAIICAGAPPIYHVPVLSRTHLSRIRGGARRPANRGFVMTTLRREDLLRAPPLRQALRPRADRQPARRRRAGRGGAAQAGGIRPAGRGSAPGAVSRHHPDVPRSRRLGGG